MKQQLSGLWKNYTDGISSVVLADEEGAYQNIAYWKNKVFCNILIFILPVSILALVPGMIMSFTEDLLFLGVSDLLAFTTVLFIALAPALKIQTRKISFIVCIYFLSLVLLCYLGSFGPAMLYLLVVTLIASIIFSTRVAYFTILIDIALCIFIGFLVYIKWPHIRLVDSYTPGAWIAGSSNLILLSIICTACLDLLVNGFKKTLLEKETAEEKFLQNEAKLRKAQEVGRLGYWQQEINGVTIWASEQAMKIYGFPPVAGSLPREMIAACIPDIDRVRAAAIGLFTQNKKYDITFAINPADGSPQKMIWAVAELETDAYGYPVRITGVLQDITDRKKAEEQIARSEKRFRSLIEKGSEIIALHDREGTLLYASPSMETTLGYLPEERVGKSGLSSVHPDDVASIQQQLTQLMAVPGSVAHAQWRHKHADGSWRWMDGVATNLLDDPAVNAVVHNFRDITQKKTEEQRLQLLESVITNTNDAVIITEAEPFDLPGQRIVYVNEAAIKLSGYTKEELIGATPRILQGPDTSREELDRLRRAMEKWQPCEIEVKNYKKNGEAFWNNMSIVPVADEKGWFTHWIAIERDVTERKLAENELREKHKELTGLSAYLQNVREQERKYIAREVHDELGQLASALKIDIDWLNLKVVSLEEAGRNRIAHAMKTIEVLISSIRKIASSLRPSVLDDFGLNAALQWHCAEFQNLNGIQCTFEPGVDDVALSIEMKTEMFRMTQESLTNVMRHAKATNVLVSTSEDDTKIFLMINDNGVGFDVKKRKNTLGLIGLRERAGSLNGTLSIESEMGKGTVVRVAIPKK